MESLFGQSSFGMTELRVPSIRPAKYTSKFIHKHTKQMPMKGKLGIPSVEITFKRFS